MTREVDIQSQLIRDARTAGAFAYKTSHRFLIGVPDLFIQMPGFPACQIEVKKLDGMPKSGVIRVDLTPHQRRHLLNLHVAGGFGGWLVVVKEGETWYGFVGTDSKSCAVTVGEWPFTVIKRRGEHWPIKSILQHLTMGYLP